MKLDSNYVIINRGELYILSTVEQLWNYDLQLGESNRRPTNVLEANRVPGM